MTHDQIVKENGRLLTAAKEFAEALAYDRFLINPVQSAASHQAVAFTAGNLANLLADRLADPADGMHTVHAGRYFGYLMAPADEDTEMGAVVESANVSDLTLPGADW